MSYRERLIKEGDSYRVVFGEGDYLSSLIVDKYGDYLVVQTLSLGMELRKEILIKILDELINPKGIYERNDVPVRRLEGLEEKKGFWKGRFASLIKIEENGLAFYVDVEDGQKTGFFLDQRENRMAIKGLVNGARVLDCFSYTGAFSLYAARWGAKKVLGIEISKRAVELARRNAELNGLGGRCQFKVANAFDELRRLEKEKAKFDLVILDPPSFAKSKRELSGAVRGYKEINLRAIKLLEKGGYLVTCSCSQSVGRELLERIITGAAADAKRNIRLIEFRTQARDHPILLACKETEYLKCLILKVD